MNSALGGSDMKKTYLIAVLLLSQVPPAFGQFGLPGKLKDVIGKGQKMAELQITEEDEVILGKSISDKICARFGVQQDAAATRYLSLVGAVAAARSSRPALPYQFVILDSDAINAFAAPGGFIHITRGALASMQNEAELAGVLAHEISHVTEKHTIKGIQKGKGLEFAQGQISSSNSLVFGKLADKMTEAILQGFGRAEELEADTVGARVASKAGYDGKGLPAFLMILKAKNEGASERSGLFASHPETQERIDKLNAQIESEKLAANAGASLADRFKKSITYQPKAPSEPAPVVEGARGLAEGDKDKGKDDKNKESGQKEEKSRFSLSRLKNPLSSGEKKQTAEVTGAGAARGVGKEGEDKEEAAGKNPNRVAVALTAEEVTQFKAAGKLP